MTMAIEPEHAPRHRLGMLHDAYVRVTLLTGAALLVEAVLAKTVLDVRLNFFAQFAPLGSCSGSARAAGATDAASSRSPSAWSC
jgi:hypothetical protein